MASSNCKNCIHHCGRAMLKRDKETQTNGELNNESRKPTDMGSHPGKVLTVICNCNKETHADTKNECICHKADIVRHINRSSYLNHQLDSSINSLQASEPYDFNIHGLREWRSSRVEASTSRKRKSTFDDVETNIKAKKARDEIVEILRRESEQKTDILEIPRRSSVKLEPKLAVMERYRDELRSRVSKS
ncbi:hypothetical protein LSTR_LSTR011365 [Laodelphax striatellus]|uniref:Uncharacterized protein n=1 Tax=Laodelphax striatellus TaxID=195883 RepID=A0A482WWC2_LAOST|nr:hypothetical protein LSTR_LSTR011365 [Laodelphax striatellus]